MAVMPDGRFQFGPGPPNRRHLAIVRLDVRHDHFAGFGYPRVGRSSSVKVSALLEDPKVRARDSGPVFDVLTRICEATSYALGERRD